jgi:hypothetical protein
MTSLSTSTPASRSGPWAPEGVANQDAAETWFAENDTEGVAFEYEVLERTRPPGRGGLLPSWPIQRAQSRAEAACPLYFFFIPDSR